MKKVITSGLVAGIILLAVSILGLYATIWLFPHMAMQYFNPEFGEQSNRFMFYFIHPFIIAMVLSWFWNRFKGLHTGSFLIRGIRFGFLYALIAVLPNMWLIYSTMNVSLLMVTTWFIFGLIQGVIAGFIFERMNP